MRRGLQMLLLSVMVASCTVPVTVTTSTTTTTTFASTTTSTVATTTTTTSPEAGHDQAILDEVSGLVTRTAQLRELPWDTEPQVTLVDDSQLADRVRQLIAENVDPDEITRDTGLEELLGLVPAGTDLLSLYQDLYSEQVLGFYDGDTKELVVPSNEDQLSAEQKVTLVHELTHALTDQHFSFSDMANALDDSQQYDALSALQTITEGDATLTELHYVASLTPDEQQAVIAGSLGQDTSVFDAAPAFIQDLLVFPYNAGLSLLDGLWSPSAGFSHIDEAYLDPPDTTEQVMHADKFAAREPAIDVSLPDTPLDGYAAVEQSVWGELLFHVMFAQVLGSQAADTAAGGWGGDQYRLLWNGSDVAFVLLYAGDTQQDAKEMQSALEDYAAAAMAVSSPHADGVGRRFTGDAYAFVSRAGDQVLFVAADDPAVGGDLRGLFKGF
jgi:hypothetical protein